MNLHIGCASPHRTLSTEGLETGWKRCWACRQVSTFSRRLFLSNRILDLQCPLFLCLHNSTWSSPESYSISQVATPNTTNVQNSRRRTWSKHHVAACFVISPGMCLLRSSLVHTLPMFATWKGSLTPSAGYSAAEIRGSHQQTGCDNTPAPPGKFP
jgi:hypothetical protein